MQEVLFCAQLVRDKEIIRLSTYVKKKFNVVGTVSKISAHEKKIGKFSREVELVMMNQSRGKILICMDDKIFNEIQVGQLVRITDLRLFPVQCVDAVELRLASSTKTKVVLLIPDVLAEDCGKKGDCLSTSKSRKVSEFCMESTDLNESVWKILIVNLSRFAESTGEGLRFNQKALVNISDKVSFVGIVISMDMTQNDISQTCIIKIRDLITNDTVNVFIFFKPDQKAFLQSIHKFYVLKITANRLVFPK